MEGKTNRFLIRSAGIWGCREGLTGAGDFGCVEHCGLDRNAERSYRALFDTKGEWYCEDIRNAEPEQLPEFDLLCGGFPCQSFSVAGHRGGFSDPRGTLFFELARLAEARKPAYLLFENVPGLLYHDCGRTFAAILHELEGMGYGRKKLLARGNRREGACNRTGEPSVTFCGEERQSVRRSRISKGNAASHKDSTRRNSRDFGVPQSRKRVYLIGYLDERCRGKVFPFTETAGTSLKQIRSGSQGERVYSCEGVSCTLSSEAGGFGGRTGLYEVSQDNLCCVDMNEKPEFTSYARCVMAKQNGGIRKRRREATGVWDGKRIRRLTPRECLRLQGWTDDRIDRIVSLQSDSQIDNQACNCVTVHVVEAIGRRLAAVHREVMEGSI